jgi:hypothetical protein
MKTFTYKRLHGRSFVSRVLVMLVLAILTPWRSYSQAVSVNDLKLIVECVEMVGADTYRAHFGYENLGTTTITVEPEKSKLVYNGGEKKILVNNVFSPGRFSYVFSRDFQGKDVLRWQVLFADGANLEIIADNRIAPCENLSGIIPYYYAPEGGKLEYSIIGPELTALYNKFTEIGSVHSDDIFQISTSGDQVLARIIAQAGQYQALLDLLAGAEYGLSEIVVSDPSTWTVSGYYPIANLLKLNSLPQLINYARPVYPSINNGGLTTTQGDLSIGGGLVRGGYLVEGEGVKVGVISNSYNTLGRADSDVYAGDLPEGVVVLKEYPGISTDEGRAMMQIVHDIAPKAQLYFRTGSISPDDFALGVQELQQAGCDIIVDDVTYITEPFFRDGVVSRAVDAVASQGVSYFTSAGNFGSKSYEGVFSR